jgi:FkbH-like protein
MYIYRNYTIEYLFPKNVSFSGYGDVTKPIDSFDRFIIFYQLNPSSTPQEQIIEIEDIKTKINYIINSNTNSSVVILNLFRQNNMDWQSGHPELITEIDRFNSKFLKEVASNYRNVKLVDINSFISEINLPVIDWKFYFTSQIIINPKIAKQFIEWFARKIQSIDLIRKKCLILDCDNTLWGGVVGEDGTHGIKIGVDYPGNCFKSFQNLLIELSQKGIILAICSKNNFEDVKDVWINNTNNLINDKVVSAYRINWQDKASNIKSIAEELNIGTESIVFFDDNPIERGLVKDLLPDVEVPEFPEKPYELVSFFWTNFVKYFSTYELTYEDLKKSEQYKENYFRNESKKIYNNIDDYLSSLDIQIDIISANESNLTRIAQMTQKTNQFNLTTKRYSEDQLRDLIRNDAKVFCANVRDKFGDNGITVSAIITKGKDQDLILDSYLLSCRILGREIEKVVLLKILSLVNPENKLIVNASFFPTAKNSLAANFLDNVGFKLVEIQHDGLKKYVCDNQININIKEYYKIIIK